MKTPMKRTVFKVILRKSEYKEQWSLIIESRHTSERAILYVVPDERHQ